MKDGQSLGRVFWKRRLVLAKKPVGWKSAVERVQDEFKYQQGDHYAW